ncbi:phage tail tube protein [Comamonas terrae]|uniref:Phage tail tube protein n=1 Tax=Comamonas terrae TaxID=673548 RepID=A0ABW5USM5_9BURK|nr:phage tail tube protein [Comamonas terrae]
MGAHVGRDVKVEFALKDEATVPQDADYKILGMMRAKSINTSWDTVDTTADKSPNFTKTSLVTFKNVEFSGDGVSYDDEVHNQEALEAHVVSPPQDTGKQPKVWLRVTYPSGKKYTGPFIVSAWSNDSPYANEATWSISAQSNGDVVLTLPPVGP